jgi:hypothetical protein
VKKRWWSAVALVLVLGIAVGGYQWKLAREHADRAAGHAAYLRADCVAALEKLEPGAERTACQQYRRVQLIAGKQRTVAAMGTYQAYFIAKKPTPLIDAAQQQFRALLRLDVARGRPDYNYCVSSDDLSQHNILRLDASDDLAAPWLAACAKTMAAQPRWDQARRLLVDLQTLFPESKEAAATLDDLVVASRKAVTGSRTPDRLGGLDGYTVDPDLGERARLTVYSRRSWPLDVTVGGDQPRFVRVPACEDCKPIDADQERCDESDPTWKQASVIVAPGRHDVHVWETSPQNWAADHVFWDPARFRPGADYGLCFFN